MKRNVFGVTIVFFIGIFLSSFSSISSMPTRDSIPGFKNTGPGEMEATADMFDLLAALLECSKKDKKPINAIQKFLFITTKFSNRSQLMTEDVLAAIYSNYDEYNVLVDFIEKIPIQKPETVLKLFKWVKHFKKKKKGNRALLISVFQSLLELFSHASKYAPNRYDYDALVSKLITIPWNRNYFYDKIFDFLKKELDIGLNKKGLIDFVLIGVHNQGLNINHTDFNFVIKDLYQKEIKEILKSQEVCSLSTILKINRLLDRLLDKDNLSIPTPTAADIGRQMIELFHQLPYAEISKEAPKSIRERVTSYSIKTLNADLKHLVKKINSNAPISDIEPIIIKIKNNYLLFHLKDYLLSLAYALNAKNPKLKVFLNPNMVRLHDFENRKDQTAWNYCGMPSPTDFFSGYHLCGGLSRLNIAFATKWHDHLFSRTYIYNPAHVKSTLINMLALYPNPMADQSVAYNALLVDFGLELLRKSQENQVIKKDLIKELAYITSGYHYRKAVNYLNGKSKDHHLFFCEIKRLGETFFKRRKYLDTSPLKEPLEAFTNIHLNSAFHNRNRGFGGIYYHTFGNLIPQHFKIFPQGVSNFFESGWVSGEMIDEFKVKLSWHLYKKKIPPFLLGQVLYSYLLQTVPRIFSQSHVNDYFATYFIFKIFNNSHLRKILKNLQKKGYLRLK